MMRTWIRLLLVALTPLAAAPPGRTGAPRGDAPRDEDRAAEALELTRRVARSLHLLGGEDRKTELALVESPLQQFSNPVVGEFYAHLFLWTHRGRPAAAASIQKWYAPNQALHVELQSLARHPLTAEYDQAPIWHPEEAGVTFQIVPGAPAPSRLAAARAREMRLVARAFRARIKAANRGGDIDEELRLLAQPVYRFKADDPSILDGAIFSFVRGTDPELLLILEARPAADGAAWHYALAPMNSFAFSVLHLDREIWHKPQSAPPWTNVTDPAKPYFLITNFHQRDSGR